MQSAKMITLYFMQWSMCTVKILKKSSTKKWRLSVTRCIEIITQVADALSYCWAKENMVHRADIKADNIMVTNDGGYKTYQYGAGKFKKKYNKYDPNNDNIEGSPYNYIPPEQILGDKQDFRSDIYSLGIVFFQCLTGQKVFDSANALEICQSI